jgi:hypothetical protein
MRIQRMTRPLHSSARLVVLAMAIPIGAEAQAHCGSPSDIFSDGAEAGVLIAGHVRSPQPLADAEVTACVGGRAYRVQADAQGDFSVGISAPSPSRSTVEVFARGSGLDSRVEWHSVLGTAGDLQNRAGGDGRLTADEDPTVIVSPRTTAWGAALRVAGGGSVSQDARELERHADALQLHYTSLIGAGLILLERGDLAMPQGANTTLEAVDGLARLQSFYAELPGAIVAGSCRDWTPELPECSALRIHNTDPRIAPTIDIPEGIVLAPYLGYEGTIDRGGRGLRVGPGATSADYWEAGGHSSASSGPVPTLTAQPGWALSLGHADERSLWSVSGFWSNSPSTPTGLVYETRETYAYHVNAYRGIGGRLLLAIDRSIRRTFPDNPEYPNQVMPPDFRFVLPELASEGGLTERLKSSLPRISSGRYLVPLPAGVATAQTHEAAYDVATFSPNGSVNFERLGIVGTWQQAAVDSANPGAVTLSLASMPPSQVRLEFVAEESPALWRVRALTLNDSAQSRAIHQAMLTPAMPLSAGFDARVAPATYWATNAASLCFGPLGSIDRLSAFRYCSLDPRWTFEAGGTGQSTGSANPMSWTLGSGNDLGRLRMIWWQLSHGWQKLRVDGGSMLILENRVQYPYPQMPPQPSSFEPTGRILRLWAAD